MTAATRYMVDPRETDQAAFPEEVSGLSGSIKFMDLADWVRFADMDSTVSRGDVSAAEVARIRYGRALARIAQEHPGAVREAAEALFTALEEVGVTASVVAPSPDGGVSVSFGDTKTKHALIEIYDDTSSALLLGVNGEEPDIRVRPTSSSVLKEFSQALSAHLASA